MLWLVALTQCLVLSAGALHFEQQPFEFEPLTQPPTNATFNVAIIGAGIGGASAAYELRRFSSLESIGRKLSITVFEAESRVGGRIESVLTYDGGNRATYAEVGASHFHADDECMMNAVNQVGLHTSMSDRSYWHQSDGKVSVWDGQTLLTHSETDFTPKSWRDHLRLFFKYGRSPGRWRKLADDGQSRLRRFYDRLYWSGGNIREAMAGDSIPFERKTAHESLAHEKIANAYMTDIIEPRARGVQARDLSALNDVSLFRSAKSSPRRSIVGLGLANQSIVERLLLLARVRLRLSTRVVKIDHVGDKYSLLTGPNTNTQESDIGPYDAIIIAAPLQSAKLDLSRIGIPPRAPNYEERHVTLFTNPDSLPPKYFNTSHDEYIPKIVATKGKPDLPFYSIERETLDLGVDGCIHETENLFRITSAQPVSDDLILRLLGEPKNSSLEDARVGWVHRRVWPEAFPNLSDVTPPSHIDIAPRVHYAGGGESYEGSLENSCRFGVWAGKRVWLPHVDIEP